MAKNTPHCLNLPRTPGSRVLLKVTFTPAGCAHFVHCMDLRQSWENWWRLYGDLHLSYVDLTGKVLYTTCVMDQP